MTARQVGAVLGSHAKLWAALTVGAITFLMLYRPDAAWAHAAALALNAVLVYLVPNYQPSSEPPSAVQQPPGG